jgi:hypothetical protein
VEDVVGKDGSFASWNADFERFVYADVATEPNGMELSVLSALSRLGLDPWQEAQRLAQLPPFAAADGLAQLLRAVPAVRALRLDVKVIAERLVALLPVERTVTGGQFPSKLAATTVQVPRGRDLWRLANASFYAKASGTGRAHVLDSGRSQSACKAPGSSRAISQFDPTRSS